MICSLCTIQYNINRRNTFQGLASSKSRLTQSRKPISPLRSNSLALTIFRFNTSLILSLVPKPHLPHRSSPLNITIQPPLTRPPIGPQRTRNPNTPPKSASPTTRTPSPARTTSNGEMVHVKPDISEENAERGAEENIKTMVSIIEPTRRSNKARRGSRHERN